jgi:hypothetical protein
MRIKRTLPDGTIKIYTYDQRKYANNKGTRDKKTGKSFLYGVPYQEYYKQKLMCKCGCNITRKNMKTHTKSKKHEKLMLELEPKPEI